MVSQHRLSTPLASQPWVAHRQRRDVCAAQLVNLRSRCHVTGRACGDASVHQEVWKGPNVHPSLLWRRTNSHYAPLRAKP